jgi:hypothetical protein
VSGKRVEHVDPAERRLQKDASRLADAHALASGRKDAAQLRSENEVLVSPGRPARIELPAARSLA